MFTFNDDDPFEYTPDDQFFFDPDSFPIPED